MWNQGREAIEKADILRPLVLNTADHTSILEAVIRQQTRPDIVRLQLDAAEQKRGRLGVSWEVLEEGDGGIVQLILAGTPDVKVSAEAALKGQRQIREVTFPQHIVSPEQQYDVLRRRSSVWLWGWLGFWLAFTGFNVYALSTERRRWARAQELLEKYLNPLPDELLQRVSFTHLPRWKRWARYVGPLAFILVGVYMVWLFLTALLTTFPPTPPLDF